MNDDEFNLFYFMLLAIFASVMLSSSWESCLHYLNGKQIVEAIKDQDPKYTNDQMQGLLNNIKK